MTRQALFEAIRPFAPERRFSTSHVQSIDALADDFGLPRIEPAKASEIPEDYWPMLSKIESGDRPYIKAPTSSASGLYQFIKSTWIGEGGKWGIDPNLAFGGLRPSEAEQRARAATFTEKNLAYLKRQGVPINRASLYAAHFFGPATAAKVINADVKKRADLLAGEEVTKANPSILRGKTVGEFLTWLHKKTGEWAR